MNNWKFTAFYGIVLVALACLLSYVFDTTLDHIMIWVLFGAYLAHVDGKYSHAENIHRIFDEKNLK